MAWMDQPVPGDVSRTDAYEDLKWDLGSGGRLAREYEQKLSHVMSGLEPVDAGDVCKWATVGKYTADGGVRLWALTLADDCYAPREAEDWLKETQGGGCKVAVGEWRIPANIVAQVNAENGRGRKLSPGQVLEYVLGGFGSMGPEETYDFHSLRNAVRWMKEQI